MFMSMKVAVVDITTKSIIMENTTIMMAVIVVITTMNIIMRNTIIMKVAVVATTMKERGAAVWQPTAS